MPLFHTIAPPLRWAYSVPARAGASARPFTAEAAGLSLERRLHDLTGARSEWFKFCDASGIHHCQIDGLLAFQKKIILFECKLRWHSYVKGQIFKLLKPVVEAAYLSKLVCPVVVLQNSSFLPHALNEILEAARPDKIVRWSLGQP